MTTKKQKIVVTFEGEGKKHVVVLGHPLPYAVKLGRGRAWKKADLTAWQKAISSAAMKQYVYADILYDGPVALVTQFRRKGRDADVDNLHKAVQDALKGIAYEDDKQVIAVATVKEPDPKEGVDIHILKITKVTVETKC